MRATQKYLEVTFVSNACIFVSVCDCDCDCTQQSLDALWSRVRSPRESSSVAASSAATPTLATCCRYICGSRCCCCHKRKTECMTNVRLARGCSSNQATAVAGVSSRYKIHGLPVGLPACVGLPVLACLAVEQFIRLSIGWQVVGRPRLAFQTRRQISS